MAKDYLPTQVDPFRFAENAATLHGTLPLGSMQRLGTGVLLDDGIVTVDMVFGVDEQGIRFLRGHIASDLHLQCQRCMGSFVYAIMSDFSYGLVNTEKKVSMLPSGYEPLVIKNEILNLPSIVEEELIINLPIVPMHDPADCNVKLPIVVVDDPQAATAVEKENPFKVIELLKVKPKQK